MSGRGKRGAASAASAASSKAGATSGRGKRGAASSQAGQPSAKQPKTTMWCTVCWAWEAKSKCTKHRCLPIAEAMTEAQTAFDVVHEDMKRKEKQLMQVTAAFEEKGAAVLEARLEGVEAGDWEAFCVEGGTFRIHLAATSVTECNKEDLLEALKDSSVEFDSDSEPILSLSRDLVKSLYKNLPIRPSGVTLPPGTVLIRKGHQNDFLLTVHEKGVLPHKGDGQKLFGRVSEDTLKTFQTCWCGGEGDCDDKHCDHEDSAESKLVDARFL